MHNLEFIPGTPVAVYVCGIRHVGIASDGIIDGEQGVLSSSRRRGQVTEESLSTFSQGRSIKPLDAPADKTAAEVLWRARQQLGRPWHLWQSNCEHFVYSCYGLPPKSPQLQVAAATALLLAGIWGISRRR